MNDPYDLDIVPLNVFENKVIPVGIHNLSKSFRPNMTTIGVLSLGTKLIPKWRNPIANLKNTFKKLVILAEECKTPCFSRKPHREHIV
jgi:hypothetical protein